MTVELSVIKSFNPASGEMIGQVPVMGPAEIDSAVSSAWTAWHTFSLTPFSERVKLMHAFRQHLVRQKDEIADLICREVGKPLVECLLAELTGPLEAAVWFSESTQRLLKDQMIQLTNPLLASKQSLITFEPLGVIGIISPWNYPFAIPVMSTIMALMTGNTVVLKPSEKAPCTGMKIGDLFTEAGFPKGVVSIVTGNGATGRYLCQSRLARIIFTGSVATGQKVMAAAANNVTPLSLELGGKDPAVVLPDAPPDWTARGLVWGAFTNCGQACASIERVYIVTGKRTRELIEAMVKHTRALRVGPPADPSTEIGPLIDAEQLCKVKEHVEDAKSKGAHILVGGRQPEGLAGSFYEPTILTDVDHSMKIMTEETFGPVLPVMIVDSEDKAIELANESQYGLSASVWGDNLARAEDVARDLDAGTVLINDCLFSYACPQAPWGGLKKSGMGRTHSHFGLIDFVNIKHISIDAAGPWHRLWWYPYGASRVDLVRGGIELLHGAFPLGKLNGLIRFLYNSIAKPKPPTKDSS